MIQRYPEGCRLYTLFRDVTSHRRLRGKCKPEHAWAEHSVGRIREGYVTAYRHRERAPTSCINGALGGPPMLPNTSVMQRAQRRSCVMGHVQDWDTVCTRARRKYTLGAAHDTLGRTWASVNTPLDAANSRITAISIYYAPPDLH